MSDDDDLDLDGTSGVDSAPKKSSGLVGLLPKLLKFIAIGLGALIFIVTVAVITFNFLNKGGRSQTSLAETDPYVGKRPEYSYFTAIGQIRTWTNDPTPASVVVNITLGYDMNDKLAQNELTNRLYELRAFVRSFFASKSADELKPEYEAQLQQEITAHFPKRLGSVTPMSAGAFPLTRRHALQYVQPGLALVGDAAHTIHPLAGQGVNLGYRDVDALLDILAEARGRGEAWSSLPVLKRYQARRRADNFIMQSGMDLFYAGFSNDLAPVRVLRNIGLMAAERAGVLKRQALKYALGL